MKPKPYPQTTKSAAMLFFLINPGINGKRLSVEWGSHPVLSDYQQPDEPTLISWVEEFIAWRNEVMYRDQYRAVKSR